MQRNHGSSNSTSENNTASLPTVNFTANVTNGTAPLNVSFTSNCTGNPTEFNWTFGDGIYSKHNLTTIHTYSQPGKYNVSLTVSNAVGNKTAMKLGYIIVFKTASTNNKVLCSGKAPVRVHFIDRSKRHISWQWSFGDGNTSRSKSVVHIYKKPGKYPVKLSYKTIGHINKTLYAGYVIVK